MKFARLLSGPVLAMAVLVVAGVMVGCESAPRPGSYNVVVEPAPTFTDAGRMPSIEVDLVGVGDGDRLERYPVSQYFSGGDAVRRAMIDEGRVKTFTFTDRDPAGKTLESGEAIWRTWLDDNATQLVVLANLPGVSDQDPDPRREVLPLDRRRWDGRTIRVTIHDGLLQVRPSPKPAP